MRCVVDTNVLISALGWDGNERRAVRMLVERSSMLTSSWLLDEFRHAALQPRMDFTESEIDYFLDAFLSAARLVMPEEKITVCRDADDNKVIECAVAGKADCIITGDTDLLKIGEFRGIKIITAGDFLKLPKNY